MIGNHTVSIIERNAVEFCAVVADRAIERVDGQFAHFACSADAARAVRFGALVPERTDAPVSANDLDRVGKEVQV